MYILADGGRITASDPSEFVRLLREGSWFDSGCTDKEYMVNFSNRYHEMLRRVGPHRHPVQFPVPPGEIHHVLPVGAPAVKPAALTQDAYKLGRAGGGNPAAIRQNT